MSYVGANSTQFNLKSMQKVELRCFFLFNLLFLLIPILVYIFIFIFTIKVGCLYKQRLDNKLGNKILRLIRLNLIIMSINFHDLNFFVTFFFEGSAT